jgi:hypothetical protein
MMKKAQDILVKKYQNEFLKIPVIRESMGEKKLKEKD